MTYALELKGLRKSFGEIEALCGIDLRVNTEEIFGFIGPNGAGKTTAIRTMLGFYKPTGGSVRLLGHDPRTELDKVGPRLGVMLERPGLNASLTALEHLEYYGGLFGLPRAEAQERARRQLDFVGLLDRGQHRLITFSKGMRQRVTLARCLINDPDLLILDEPFDGIDAETRRYILELIPKIARERGTSIFVTSHNLPEVEKICDRVAVIKQGRILACDAVEKLTGGGRDGFLVIKLAEAVPSARIAEILPQAVYREADRELSLSLAEHNGSTRDIALKALLAHDISVDGMRQQKSSLEEVYFSLTEAKGDDR